jgi:hypothetical protein
MFAHLIACGLVWTLGAIRGLVLDGGTSPPIEVNHVRGGSQIESPASH